jgi:hypothetical protein
MLLKPTLVIAVASASVIIAAACGSDEAPPEVTEPTVSTNAIPTAEFDVDSFAALNPNPQIRELDLEIDLGFYERDRIPRDAIEPIYTPKFVSPTEADLRSDEIVMGLVINGEARAYPTGLLRVREMVNDEVGGTPVLVSW